MPPKRVAPYPSLGVEYEFAKRKFNKDTKHSDYKFGQSPLGCFMENELV